MKKPPTLIALTGLAIALLIWGGTTVVGKLAVSQFPLFSTLFLRFCIACLALLPLLLFDRHRPRFSWSMLLKLALLGSLGTTINIGLFFFGIRSASALDAAVIIALGPLLLCVAGCLFLGEPWRRWPTIGLCLAAAGALLALTLSSGPTHHSLIGNLAIFASEIALIAYTIWSKDLLKTVSPIALTSVSFFVAMVTFAPLAVWEYLTMPQAFTHVGPTFMWELLYIGILSSVVAYCLYEWSLQYLSALQVSAMSYIQPLAGGWLGIIILGEHFSWLYLVGGILTAIGMAIALFQPQHVGRPAKEALHTRHPHHRS